MASCCSSRSRCSRANRFLSAIAAVPRLPDASGDDGPASGAVSFRFAASVNADIRPFVEKLISAGCFPPPGNLSDMCDVMEGVGVGMRLSMAAFVRCSEKSFACKDCELQLAY